MRPIQRIGYLMAVPVLALLAFSGCFGDLGVTLLVSPETLDFGRFEEEALLRVSKNASSTNMGPVQVSSNVPWIIPERCVDGTFDCYSFGPRDHIEIPVRLDRGKMALGENKGALILNARGASIKRLDVKAEKILNASFSADQRRIDVNGQVNFTNSIESTPAAGEVTGYLWNFGDGSSSTNPNPTKTYTEPGYYTVSLMVETESASDTHTRTAFVVVGDAPPRTVDFTADRTILYAGQSVQFTDLSEAIDGAPIESWHWDFGFGATSTQQHPRQQFSTPGAFDVTLTVTTAYTERSVTKEKFILVQDRIPPQADFLIEDPVAFIGDEVQFTDLSFIGNNQVAQRLWRFGDGTTSTAANPTHIYREAGTFQVTLTIATPFGSSTATQSIEVRHKPPTADFEASITTPATGQTVQFTDLSLPGSSPISNWFWSFGDGNTSTEREPSHSYANPGTYTVSLRVFNQNPQNNTDIEVKFNYIRVFAPPSPDFTIELPEIPGRDSEDHASILTTDSVQFINQTAPGTEADIDYTWSFLGDPDVVQSEAENPTYTFAEPGQYRVYQTATTATQSATTSRVFTVNRPPVPNFTATPRNTFDGVPITFDNQTSTPVGHTGERPITATGWDFGDGNDSFDFSPTHTYETPGSYDVSLTVEFNHSGTGRTLSFTEVKPDYIQIEEAPRNLAIVDTLNDVADGDTSSIVALNRDRGPDGFISLREAIEAASNTDEEVTIGFAVSGVIAPESMLPAMANMAGGISMNADGAITLDGSLLSGFIPGLIIESADNHVQGFDVVNFPGPGLYIVGGSATNNRIENSLFGTDGSDPLGNELGVFIDNAPGNFIGGSEPGTGNVISGNVTNGVMLTGSGATENQILGNQIGLSLDGRSELPNGERGVALLSGANNNLIGGSTPEEGNVISGNANDGILLDGNGTEDNLIVNCYIGSDPEGLEPMANTGSGIHIRNGAQNNLIGGTEEGEWNLISGNQGHGVRIQGDGTTGTLIRNALIGADVQGEPNLGNFGSGVFVSDGASDHQILGLGGAMQSIIAGNALYGVHVSGAESNGVTISENSIHANFYSGIFLAEDANDAIEAPVIMDTNPVNGMAPSGSQVELFADTGGQGMIFIETLDATTGFFSSNVDLSDYVGMNLTATAMDVNGNTSEFSEPTPIVSGDDDD